MHSAGHKDNDKYWILVNYQSSDRNEYRPPSEDIVMTFLNSIPLTGLFLFISVGTGGGGEALAPSILSIMYIKYAEFILDTPSWPPQSCLCSYTSDVLKYPSIL